MTGKITQQNLNALLGRVQRAIGDPAGPVWTRDANGQNRARVGALMLEQGSKTNGIGWKFVQVVNGSGGQRTLIRGSTARELWNAAQAWLDGFDAAAARIAELERRDAEREAWKHDAINVLDGALKSTEARLAEAEAAAAQFHKD